MTVPILLRPHHGLCIPRFVGRGYQPAFTEHLADVAAHLRAHPDTPIVLIRGADDLCGVCPNRVGSGCGSERADRFDQRCLRWTGCRFGERMLWQEYQAKLSRIDGGIARVCPDCEWFALCARQRSKGGR